MDPLAEARSKAAQIREAMKGKTADEKALAKEQRAEEKRAKARAKYAEKKAEQQRLKDAAQELEILKAKPPPPPSIPEKMTNNIATTVPQPTKIIEPPRGTGACTSRPGVV